MNKKTFKSLQITLITLLITIIFIVIFISLQKNNSFNPSTITTKNKYNIVNNNKKSIISCEYQAIIRNFYKKLPQHIDKNDEQSKKFIESVINDTSIDRLTINNDECGANAASWLAKIFSNIRFKEKAMEYHKIVLNFADLGNQYAIRNICIGEDPLASTKNRVQFCENVFDNRQINYDSKTIFLAYKYLSSYYFDTNQGVKFINFCEKTYDRKSVCYYSYMFPSVNRLADKLYNKKDYKQAVFLYETSAPYDELGKTQALLGFVYFHGIGVKVDLNKAISWFNESLIKNNPDNESIIINQIGLAYENQNKYLKSFQYYSKAAFLGNALGQFNLARQYALGHGTIQDYKEAYAWVSVAIAQGLNNKENQNRAEQLQTWFKELLQEKDKKGLALAESLNLAKKYYQLYVLHKDL